MMRGTQVTCRDRRVRNRVNPDLALRHAQVDGWRFALRCVQQKPHCIRR